MSKYSILLAATFFFSTVFSGQARAQITISEQVHEILNAYLASPLNLVPFETRLETRPAKEASINLLKWSVSAEDPPAPTERYNRLQQFGTWIVVQQENRDCTDTRNKVLIRDSQSQVTMRANNACKVDRGEWYDPYTDKNYNLAADVQIDHFVPLKDAYINGAWTWNYQTRCLYANFMGYRDHLKPVNGNQNMLKSDNNPISYMPPNTAYRCEYLKTWLSVKLIWKLGMQRAEAQGIKNLLEQMNCNTADFKFSSAQLKEIREYIQNNAGICPQAPPESPVRGGGGNGSDPSVAQSQQP